MFYCWKFVGQIMQGNDPFRPFPFIFSFLLNLACATAEGSRKRPQRQQHVSGQRAHWRLSVAPARQQEEIAGAIGHPRAKRSKAGGRRELPRGQLRWNGASESLSKEIQTGRLLRSSKYLAA